MSTALKILPGTGRGTAQRSCVVEGLRRLGRASPSTGFAGPPPRNGEDL
jgi:hypothetical protein